jgi:hypothetical protein
MAKITISVINLINENTNHKVWQRQTPGHSRGGIRCGGGASIPYRPFTLAVLKLYLSHSNSRGMGLSN